ncbi:MAG: translocation/assembly module TamB [Alloprevotella sp.]|nr:translocation/assembly module TamB [Alloprevotella sp.]
MALLNFDFTQRWLGNVAEHFLENKLGTEVKIDKIGVDFLNRLIVHDITIKDKDNEILLKANQLTAKIEWRSLLSEQLSLRTISLLDAEVLLYKKEGENEPNYQFVIDAFKSDNKEKKALNLRINSIILRRVNVSYDDYSKQRNTEKLDPNHLKCSDITANISLKEISDKRLILRVRDLHLEEQSGLKLEKLTCRIEANQHGAEIQDIILKLPHSLFKQKKVSLSFDASSKESFIPSLHAKGELDEVSVRMSDLGFLIPQLKKWDQDFQLQTSYELKDQQIKASVRSNSFDNDFILLSTGQYNWKNNGQDILHLDVDKIHLASGFISSVPETIIPLNITKVLSNLGAVNLNGTITQTALKNWLFNLDTQTEKGRIDASGKFDGKQLKTDIQMKEVLLSEILQNPSVPKSITLATTLSVNKNDQSFTSFGGQVDIPKVVFKDFEVEKVKVNTEWNKYGQSIAHITVEDKNTQLTSNIRGNFDGKHLSNTHIEFDIDHIDLSAYPVGELMKDKAITGAGNIEIKTLVSNSTDATVHLKNFAIQTPDTTAHIADFIANINQDGLTISTDFAEISLQGNPSIKKILAAGQQIVHKALPNLVNTPKTNLTNLDQWSVRGKVLPTHIFRVLFNQPVTLTKPLYIDGQLNPNGVNSFLSLSSQDISYGKQQIQDLRIYVEDRPQKLACLIQGDKWFGSQLVNWEIDTKAVNEILSTTISWKGQDDEHIGGTLHTQATFEQEGKKFFVNVIPSQFYLGNKLWHSNASSLDFEYGNLQVNGFSLMSDNQWLKVDGNLSKDKDDVITAELSNINLEYVMDLVNFDAVDFAGPVSGVAKFMRSENGDKVTANVSVSPLLLNNAEMGQLDLIGGFDFSSKQIDLDGTIHNTDKEFAHTSTKVDGYVNLQRKDINLDIVGEQTNLAFLQKFVGVIFDDFKGRGSGHCRLYGPLKQLDLEGEERVSASLTIPVIGTQYNVSDGLVSFSEGEIHFNNLAVNDGRQGSGEVTGVLHHNHLKNIRYDMIADIDNLLIYDQPERPDWTFYATAYGTGQAHLSGYPGNFECDINMQTEPGTQFVYLMSSPGDMSVAPFIHFGELQQDSIKVLDNGMKPSELSINTQLDRSDIRLNMNIEANENAKMQIVMDEKTGDVITTRGQGSIRADFYNKGDFRMYGTYALSDGQYRMQIQNIIRKEFNFKEGSRITFSGNPMEGDLNMQAVYTVNSASLRDLNLGNDLSTSTTKVNCLLNLQGQVQSPDVSFDIEFPNVNSDEADLFRSVISTKEDLQKQVAYLLAVGRFYAQDADQIAQNYKESQASVATKSLLSNMLSGQLNSALQNIMGVSNWTIGTNLATGSLGTRSMEAEALISGRLFNNRLLIDGNIGYRDNTYNTNNFVGDFDVQYLLTPRGEIRLKAYSKTNDRYFTKSSLTTQGVGVAFNRDFSKFKDLFKRKKKRVKQKKDASIK